MDTALEKWELQRERERDPGISLKVTLSLQLNTKLSMHRVKLYKMRQPQMKSFHNSHKVGRRLYSNQSRQTFLDT